MDLKLVMGHALSVDQRALAGCADCATGGIKRALVKVGRSARTKGVVGKPIDKGNNTRHGDRGAITKPEYRWAIVTICRREQGRE
jgi:hypothetical protein